MDVAAFVFAVLSSLAAVAAVVVAVIARNDSQKAGVDAEAAANRATIATEKMATIQSRIFDGPPWTVAYFGGDTYIVTNNSPVDALDVVFDSDSPEVTIQMTNIEPQTVGAKSAVKFMFVAMLNTPFERNIVVTWRREGAEGTFRWQHPIPLKPRA